ncbi:hypothetical protein EUTSA_v10022928mg [Eutrema salsugineum]|uniref:Uncharacterized protein n=1 Tax=Eutrema salsugineum TaxID=72664 RepID=V4NW90_EUTSA|nr:hypothetical protein EUTSA_v10022928mg [Eutrema salsugineum]
MISFLAGCSLWRGAWTSSGSKRHSYLRASERSVYSCSIWRETRLLVVLNTRTSFTSRDRDLASLSSEVHDISVSVLFISGSDRQVSFCLSFKHLFFSLFF